jgi:FkbM family methyltransferase
LRALLNLLAILRWSLKLDREFLFAVPGIPLKERLSIVFRKYLFFLRDRCRPAINSHNATAFGLNYRYNDRFGLGSIQRVFCSSWRLKEMLPPRPVVVDVGANLGQFNLFCRAYLHAKRVISIEPIPSCYQHLAENVERPTDCINMLVTGLEYEARFFVACDSQLSSTVRDEGGEYCGEIMVQGMPLNRMLNSAGIDRIDLLKIDTEGSEMDVLLSAGELLEKTDVVLVEMSIFRKNLGNIFAVGSFLETRGFRLHELIFSGSTRPADADGIFVRSVTDYDCIRRASSLK